MISAFVMGLYLAWGKQYLSSDVQALVGQDRIHEALLLLQKQGYAHLIPLEEAEQGFREGLTHEVAKAS
jgi:hypothetical protein